MDIYDRQTYDFRVVKGNTLPMKFNLKNAETGAAEDITNWGARFNIRDPLTNDVITALEKTHNDSAPSGDGIYYSGDIYKPTNLGLTLTNQMAVVLEYEDTDDLEEGVYPFDIKFTIGESTMYAPIRGNIIVLKEVTPNE